MIYKLKSGKHEIETDIKRVISREIRKLKRKGKIMGDHFHVTPETAFSKRLSGPDKAAKNESGLTDIPDISI